MLFNSIEFVFFLPIIFGLYWFVFRNDLRNQNILIVLSSYVFYGWWDWRFLILLVFSSCVDFLVGRGLSATQNNLQRQALFYSSIIVNLGVLGFFKYYNFFVDSFVNAFTFFGVQPDRHTLNIVLPVGISFYTFQTLSYTIDVYKRKLEPTRDLVAFLAFVSFFPQLVAGPIERATNLLPQFQNKRTFSYPKAVDGMRQMLWGFFKKVVIADSCAVYVNDIFGNYQHYNGSTLLLGVILFSFQIYCDFSGYSDIALGTAKLFGFSLMRNFAVPYFSRDIAEFWRRWHISLSTWFKDYVYIPLGGNRGNTRRKIRNTLIVFLLSGFWHGANWTFIVWGALHALFFLPLLIQGKNRMYTDDIASTKILPNIKELAGMISTFLMVSFAWIFFRSLSIADAFRFIGQLFTDAFVSKPEHLPYHLLFFIGVLIIMEWLMRHRQHPLAFENTRITKPTRWAVYQMVLITIVFFWGMQTEFIYFQF